MIHKDTVFLRKRQIPGVSLLKQRPGRIGCLLFRAARFFVYGLAYGSGRLECYSLTLGFMSYEVIAMVKPQ